MKDYTKYDFAAIVGAEVRIDFKNIYIAGKLVADNGQHVYIQTSDGTVTSIGKKLIPNLTAKIKVEDMSVKQLKRVLDEDVYNSVVFSRDENVIYEQMEIASELSGDYIERNYNDYIDCTDWGWKHE